MEHRHFDGLKAAWTNSTGLAPLSKEFTEGFKIQELGYDASAGVALDSMQFARMKAALDAITANAAASSAGSVPRSPSW